MCSDYNIQPWNFLNNFTVYTYAYVYTFDHNRFYLSAYHFDLSAPYEKEPASRKKCLFL